jgi:CRP-like cAMP-binding protein
MSASLDLPEVIGNQLLAALPREDYARLHAHLRAVHLTLGETVHATAEHQRCIHFPTTAVVSLLHAMKNGAIVMMGLAGKDGAVGIATFLGGRSMPNGAIVQIAGESLRLDEDVLQKEFSRGGPLQRILLRYTQALMCQISQTAVCNRVHFETARLARWLLECHDRVQGDELLMTQEHLAIMLGGRRESVSVAASSLQDAGWIRYVRGHIRIVDRRGLEGVVCECYPVVRDEFRRLLHCSGLGEDQRAPVEVTRAALW